MAFPCEKKNISRSMNHPDRKAICRFDSSTKIDTNHNESVKRFPIHQVFTSLLSNHLTSGGIKRRATEFQGEVIIRNPAAYHTLKMVVVNAIAVGTILGKNIACFSSK